MTKYVFISMTVFLFVSTVVIGLPSGAIAQPTTPAMATDAFKVFDGTLYTNKPDMKAFGISPIRIVYPTDMWQDFKNDAGLPDQIKIRDLVNKVRESGSIVIIDIEHWPVTVRNHDGSINTYTVLNDSVLKYKQVLSLFRMYAPELRLGYYGHPPVMDYWRTIDDDGKKSEWIKENDRLQTLADFVDILFPSLYTANADRDGWVKYAKAQIAEARRLAKGKPVYVFLWPQYHDANPVLGLEFIAADYWKLQLDTARQYADGIVIWGGWDGKRNKPAVWRDGAEWWQVTKKFMTTLYPAKERAGNK
jgi:hypothetical protein